MINKPQNLNTSPLLTWNLCGFFVIPTDFQSWSFKRTLGTDATVSLYCSHVFGWSILFHDDKSKEPDLHKKSSVAINQYSFTTFDKTLNIWQTPIKLMLQICVVTMIGVTQNSLSTAVFFFLLWKGIESLTFRYHVNKYLTKWCCTNPENLMVISFFCYVSWWKYYWFSFCYNFMRLHFDEKRYHFMTKKRSHKSTFLNQKGIIFSTFLRYLF